MEDITKLFCLVMIFAEI